MEALLQVIDVHKSFPGVRVLQGVSMDIRAGEVHCLIGENGAGKSTLIKILMGIEKVDRGQLLWQGHPVTIHSPQDAYRLGIAYVPQELTLMPDMTVAENLWMGRFPVHRRMGVTVVDVATMQRRAQEVLDRVGLKVPPHTLVRQLGPADMQLCQIARALLVGARFIILDEPTAALGISETQQLFAIIRKLCADGVAFLYVTHRLDEIPQIGHRITVLRDGLCLGTHGVTEVNKDQMVRWMVGDKAVKVRKADVPGPAPTSEIALNVQGLTRRGVFADVSFAVRAGEIVGIFGLVGSKRTDVLRALMGLDPVDSGRMEVWGQPLTRWEPGRLTRLGVAWVPEERRQQALALDQSVRMNMSLASVRKFVVAGTLQRLKERSAVQAFMDRLRIQADQEKPVRLLSGGTQQKAVLGRWLMAGSRLFLIDEPTRGIDIGARGEIYSLMQEIVQQGGAILMVSSDMEEVFAVSHRVLVMRAGRLVAEYSKSELTAEAVMASAFG
ncbi:MAG: sugar ABC transporter ATP-binding protein [Alicyclobacillus sp.]|nr:sugar ABC transporter ATP-binding protein [Alicyclobacillus sp.]